MDNLDHFLLERGVKPTANRLLVLRALMGASRPMSLQEIDFAILTMDRSSVFRVLRLFADSLVVHVIDDGSGSIKYELCHGHGHCSPDDMHIHFYCESCRRTFCLEDVHIPQVTLPDGFVARYFNFVVKGECPDCRSHGAAAT